MRTIFASLAMLLVLTTSAQKNHYLIIGTYTSTGSDGIYVYKFNSDDGSAQAVSSIKSSNPSFVAVSSNQKYVYAVNEDNPGYVTSFAFDNKTGSLKEINRRSVMGAHPCYVAIDKTGKWLTVGNYSSGSLALFPIAKDGSLDSTSQVIEHSGYGVNTDRQEGPHVHATVFAPDNKTLYVPDLGIDKVMVYSFDSKKGNLTSAATPFLITEPGAGPRHFEFHPNGKNAYLIEELTGSISVYRNQKGRLDLIQNVSALPGDYDGPIGSADIHVSPDGKFLYASNRGESNTIGIFSIDSYGRLSRIGHTETMGKTPRNFNFDPTGKFLLVANQNSDEIVVFNRDKKTGMLTDSGKRITVKKPVCLKWARSE